MLSNYFIHQYDFKSDDNEAKVEPVALWTKRALERNLPRFIGDDSEQEIEIVLVPENSDIDNIRSIGTNLHRFNKELEYYEHPVDVYEPFALVDKIKPNVELAIRFATCRYRSLHMTAQRGALGSTCERFLYTCALHRG